MNRLMPLAQAAVLLGFRSADAVYRAIRRGHIPSRFTIRLGRSIRLDVGALLDFLRAEAARAEERQSVEARP